MEGFIDMQKTFSASLAGLAGTVLAALLVSSCASATQEAPSTRQAGLPNPASVNCIKRGGTLQIGDAAGGQTGICTFPNGAQCEQWALLRGQCSPTPN
jgi:uncharacterized protein